MFKALTSNLPGIRYKVLVPGWLICSLPGNWFDYWFEYFERLLGEPGRLGIVPGFTEKFLVQPGTNDF